MPDTSNDTGTLQGVPGAELHIRELAVPFSKSQITQLDDGDLLIRDVPMLAEGEWTDAAVKTPLFYPATTLEKDATNWLDNSGYNRHQFGVPRRSTDKVAEALNPHFGTFTDTDGMPRNGVISDVKVYGFTQNGRDMQEMIKRKLIKFVSVEHEWGEQFNPALKRLEATTVKFLGFALVPKGACRVCRFNEAPQVPAEPKNEIPNPVERDTMEQKDLEAAVAAAMAPVLKELEALKVQTPPEAPKVEIPKELTDTITAMEKRLKELEMTPAAPQTRAASSEEVKELGEPDTQVMFDRKSKIARMV